MSNSDSTLADVRLTNAQVDALARVGCGGDNIKWTFSDEGLRQTLAAFASSMAQPNELMCLAELMRGLEIPLSALSLQPQALYSIGAAIARQAKSAQAQEAPEPLAHLKGVASMHAWQSFVVCQPDDPNAVPVYAAPPASQLRLTNAQVRTLMQVAHKWAWPDAADARSDDLEMALRSLRLSVSPTNTTGVNQMNGPIDPAAFHVPLYTTAPPKSTVGPDRPPTPQRVGPFAVSDGIYEHMGDEYQKGAWLYTAPIDAEQAMERASFMRAACLEAQAHAAAAQADAARFAWYFSDKPKGDFLMTYLDGMKSGWTTDQWRAAIDAAMAQEQTT